MNILIVSQYYEPENFRINDLSRALAERGHRVTVLTGKPNYPAGDFYPGYSMFGRSREVLAGIPVIRVPMLPRKRGSLRLVLNYFSFAASAAFKAKTMKETGFDVIYVFETSPITVALPAIAMKKRIHAPVIMNVQDLWPENVISITGLNNRLALAWLDRLVNYIYRHCDLILTASKSFVPRVRQRVAEADREKVVFWPQYAVVKRSDGMGALPMRGEDFNIIFTGNLGQAQGLTMVMEAAARCKAEKGRRIVWHLVGNGRAEAELKEMAKKLSVEDVVRFHGSYPEAEIPGILNQADAALLILKPDPIFDMTLPAKLQTYLACGAAILACVRGESKELVEEAGAGITTAEVSGAALAAAAARMAALPDGELARYREAALCYSRANFDKESIIAALEGHMERLRNQKKKG